MEYNTIEINLEPSGSQAPSRTSATYEEAFLGGGEEMSNARGRGRARRKKRRLERIKNRREVRTERRKLKSDRQEERLARRRKRKQLRQEMRDEQQEARMERRNKRREDRENRRGNEPEGDEEDEDTQTTQDTGDDRDEDTGSRDNSSVDEDEDAGSDDYASDEDEDAGSDDYASDEDDEEASFDGVNYDFDGESSDFISEATGNTTKVSPLIQEICMKIEWNNEMLMRLANKKKQMLNQGKDVSAVNSAIEQKFDRVQNLENKLENFAGADGKVDKSRAKEIQLAKRMARRKRLAMISDKIPPVIMAKLLKKGLSQAQISEWWKRRGQKRIGNKSKFEGEDSVSDRVMIVDEPIDVANWGMPSTEFDVDLGGGEGFDPMSFATGETTSGSGNFWKSLLVGVVVGGVLIYVIRRYKLLKD